MSLIAHWPLDGNANDVIGTRDGTLGASTWVSDGKIGQALSSTRITSSNVLVPHDSEISKRIFGPESDNFSICFWYYPRTMSSYGTIVQKATCGSWSCSTTGFWVHGGSSLRFIIGNNTSGNGSTDYKGIDATLTLNEWHFCVGSLKDGIMYLYVDNALIGTNNANLITNRTETTSPIILGGARVSTYADGLDGKVNDVRIYDHVLSDKEMQEIAKAKVLHYTFNQLEEPTTNVVLVHNTNPFNGDGGGVNLGMVSAPSFRGRSVARHTTGTSANFYLNGSGEISTATSSTEWSSTFYIKREDGVAISTVGTYMYVNGNSNVNINGVVESVENGWYKVTRTRTGLVNGYVTLAGCYGLAGTTNYYIAAWQIEPKDHVTEFVEGSRTGTVRDMSGYGHDTDPLTELSTPQWLDTTHLGSGAYGFYPSSNASSQSELGIGKSMDCTNVTLPEDSFSLAFWTYRTVDGFQGGSYISFGQLGTGGIDFYDNNFNLSTNISNQTLCSMSFSTTLNNWEHNVIVFDRSNANILKRYKNGVFTTNGSQNLTYINDTIQSDSRPFRIGSGIAGGVPRFYNGTIDDVRLYATALSATDVLELYNTRAQLDDTGNLHINQLEEANSILLVEYEQKNVINSTVFGNLTVLNPDVSTFVESDFTLGNYRVEGWVYVSDVIYYPARWEFTIENNTKGVAGTWAVKDGGAFVVGWNQVEFKPASYADQANAPWYNMTRLEVYKTGPTTGADTSQYVIFKDIRLVKNLDNRPIQGGLVDTGTFNVRKASEIGIADGLVGYWKLNGDAKDYGDNGNDGTVTGAVVSSGLKDLAYDFAYTTDTILVGAIGNLTNNFTISCIFNSNNIANRQNLISRNGPYFLGLSSSKIWSGVYAGATWVWPAGGTTLLSNTWYHACLTYDGANAKVYVNGVLQSSLAQTGTVTSNGSLKFGYTTGGADAPMDGKIADARIYDRNLSEEEIFILYKWGLTNTGMQLASNGTLYTNREINEGL